MSANLKMLIISLCLILPGMVGLVDSEKSTPTTSCSNHYGEDPLFTGYFTENLGQWDECISFVAETNFGKVGFGLGSVYYDIRTGEDRMNVDGHVLRYHFPGGDAIEPCGVDPLPHSTNYFLGNDPDRWITGAKSFKTVVFKDLWNGIDMQYHFGEEGLKYDLILEPGSSIEDIRIKVEGSDRIASEDRNSLTVNMGEITLMDEGLDVFYLDQPTKKIDSRFVLLSENTYGFKLNGYRPEETIMIDPLITSTYFGGTADDKGLSVDLDPEGNVVMAGVTSSSDFPTQIGSYNTSYVGYTDYFISKFDQDCSGLLFSTYIGGSGNDGYYDNYIDVVNDGILMTGTTASSDFPTTDGCYDNSLEGYYDTFFLKLDLDGEDLLFSSYLGGSGSLEVARGILGSSNNDFFVYGYTYSSDFPTTSGAYGVTISGTMDGYISKFKSTGDTLLISTFIGGSSYQDNVYHLVESPNHDIIVTGSTYSTDFPTTSGAYSETCNGYSDCFVTILKNDLSDIIYSTFFGGAGTERVYSMILGDEGNIAIVGDTYSNDFPITNGAIRNEFDGYSEGYVIEFNSNLSQLVASTYIGGDSIDLVNCINIDPLGNYIIAGYTSSSDLNTTSNAINTSNSGNRDGFISILESDLSGLEYSTYFGGSENDSIMGRIAIDPYGRAVFTGYTSSTDLTVLDPYQMYNSGATDSFLMALDITPWLEPLEVESIKLFNDINYFDEGYKFDIGQRVYIELSGTDANTSIRSGAKVDVVFPGGSLSPQQITLLETQSDSGIHRGYFRVPLSMEYFDMIEFSSWKDPYVKVDMVVDYPYRPNSINSITVHTDRFNLSTLDKMDLGQKIIFKARGSDSNPSSIDKAFVNLSSDGKTVFNNPIVLMETGLSSGEYIGNFEVPADMDYFENVTITSLETLSIQVKIMVHTPLQLRPFVDVTTVLEDQEYRVDYWNFGYEVESWDVYFTSDWLSWDEENKILHGIPNNNHIFPCDVRIEISDELGHKDKHEFRINVVNTPPDITTENILFAKEGMEYYVDYNSSDDTQGEISWSVIPDNSWFSIEENSGILSGTPLYDDAGTVNITVMVNDGNGGTGSITFMLTVINFNQPPRITSTDITTGKQGQKYQMNYVALDPDGDEKFHWELFTDASFLTINNNTGTLSGTPGIWDVGAWSVNVTVKDPGGLMNSHEFVLTIENVNDKPIWSDIPDDLEILHGSTFIFDVNATDPDIGDELEFSVWTEPESGLEINKRTGLVEWTADYTIFDGDKNELEVNIRVSDNAAAFTNHVFKITVLPTESPSAWFSGPEEKGKTSSKMTVLEWEGNDPEGETLTFWVYLSENKQFVETLRTESLYIAEYEGNSLELGELEKGKTYYWTVIPFDQCTFGVCNDNMGSFTVNNVPSINNIPQQKVNAGSSFRFKVAGTDSDGDDIGNLFFSILNGPEGIQISENDGMILWEPENDQVGVHSVTVSVSDGLDVFTSTFKIEVVEEKEGGINPIYFGMVGLAILFIIIIILQIIILTRRRPKNNEEVDREEATRELRETIRETVNDLEKVELNGQNEIDPEVETATTEPGPDAVQEGEIRSDNIADKSSIQ